MINKRDLEKLKAISIVDYLAFNGVHFAKQVGHQYVYHSPLRDEFTPSFFVDPDKNVFKDWGEEAYRGDIIRLVQQLHKVSFPEACKILQNLEQLHPSSLPDTTTNRKKEIEIVNVRDIKNPALIEYLSSRHISFSLAAKYLSEVQFVSKGKKYFALGHLNDKGGYELRNKYFKGASSPKTISTYISKGSGTLCLFEGVFDFLSALEFYKIPAPNHDTIILNSTSMYNDMLPHLTDYDSVHCFLDNDKGGLKLLESLKRDGYNVNNYSRIYHPHKDFNDFLSSVDYEP